MEKDTRYQPLDKASISADQISRPSVSYWKDAWRRFRKDKLAVFGLVMILIVSLFAIFGPMFCPYAYDEADFLSIAQWPSKAHWFGTDALGRDLYVRVLYGARISLSIGVVAALVNMVIGVLYGGIAGYFGGKVDNVMMRIVDIIIALPSLLYTILLMMLMGSNVRSILIALCLSSWVGTARITRSQVVSLKHQEYALAAKLAGASDFQILLRHLLPNAMGPIIVSVMFLIPGAIFSEAFLSFLGIGIQKPMASWGSLANDAIGTLTSAPYQMFFPIAAISLTMFSLNFIGVLYGGIAGYFGGKVDNVMMRIVDIIIALPSLLYTILLMMLMGSNVRSILIALCLSSWVGTARITRSQVVSLKHQEYALAAKLAGASDFQILLRHLLPNAMGPIIVSVMFLIPGAIFSEAFLSFLGIGIQKPMASWGSLANDAIGTLTSAPYQMFFPIAAISLTMFSLNFIGDGLRDALDPKLKK